MPPAPSPAKASPQLSESLYLDSPTIQILNGDIYLTGRVSKN